MPDEYIRWSVDSLIAHLLQYSAKIATKLSMTRRIVRALQYPIITDDDTHTNGCGDER